MLPLYLFSVLVGGALLAASLLGADQGGDGGEHAHSSGDNPVKFLSLRTMTYFLFVFGGVGSLLSWAWEGTGSIATFLLSAVAAIGVAGLVTATFRYLARTGSGARNPDDSFVGLPARVVLPIAAGGMGKVMVHRGDREYELLARPHDASSAGTMDWKSVVVVEMNGGTALVAPLDPTLQQDS